MMRDCVSILSPPDKNLGLGVVRSSEKVVLGNVATLGRKNMDDDLNLQQYIDQDDESKRHDSDSRPVIMEIHRHMEHFHHVEVVARVYKLTLNEAACHWTVRRNENHCKEHFVIKKFEVIKRPQQQESQSEVPSRHYYTHTSICSKMNAICHPGFAFPNRLRPVLAGTIVGYGLALGMQSAVMNMYGALPKGIKIEHISKLWCQGVFDHPQVSVLYALVHCITVCSSDTTRFSDDVFRTMEDAKNGAEILLASTDPDDTSAKTLIPILCSEFSQRSHELFDVVNAFGIHDDDKDNYIVLPSYTPLEPLLNDKGILDKRHALYEPLDRVSFNEINALGSDDHEVLSHTRVLVKPDFTYESLFVRLCRRLVFLFFHTMKNNTNLNEPSYDIEWHGGTTSLDASLQPVGVPKTMSDVHRLVIQTIRATWRLVDVMRFDVRVTQTRSLFMNCLEEIKNHKIIDEHLHKFATIIEPPAPVRVSDRPSVSARLPPEVSRPRMASASVSTGTHDDVLGAETEDEHENVQEAEAQAEPAHDSDDDGQDLNMVRPNINVSPASSHHHSSSPAPVPQPVTPPPRRVVNDVFHRHLDAGAPSPMFFHSNQASPVIGMLPVHSHNSASQMIDEPNHIDLSARSESNPEPLIQKQQSTNNAIGDDDGF